MLITKDTEASKVKSIAGGKAFSLYQLSNADLPVPQWVCLSIEVLQQFQRLNMIDKTIDQIIADTHSNNIKKQSQKIQNCIEKAPYPDAIATLIKDAVNHLSCEKFAVRSSALDEDSRGFSFAGQLSTFLFVQGVEDALRYVKACWASAYSERSLAYRLKNKLLHSGPIEVAVILQEMIDCDRSAVVFSCDPVRKRTDHMMINAVYGLGEGLVSGHLDADTYVLDKCSFEVIEKDIASKTTTAVYAGSGQVELVNLKDKYRYTEALTKEEIQEIAAIALAIEKEKHMPQDIECGWHKGKLYLFQARPITTFNNAFGKLQIWDNANISESYQGLTLPLTFTFAQDVYHRVYVQLCEILLIPTKDIRNLNPFLRNMLGCINGRVYYNLLNWYRLISLLPGFNHNRSFMETMMGVDESVQEEILKAVSSSTQQTTWRRIVVGLRFIYFHIRAQSLVDKFLRDFTHEYNHYRQHDYSAMASDEIFSHYQTMKENMLGHWKAPIINDFLCMIHFGILNKLTHTWLPANATTLHNDLLCGEGSIESAAPTRELMKMAAWIKQDAALHQLFKETPADKLYPTLKRSEHKPFFDMIKQYIDLYGFRCMGEMKLEQKDLHQDPSFLFVCLQNYLTNGDIDLDAIEAREQKIRWLAEQRIKTELTPIKRWVYCWSLKHARKAVKNRENTRFCRTRVYGVVRAMFHAIGDEFNRDGVLDEGSHLFYLTINELEGIFSGTLPSANLKTLVEHRQQEYTAYKNSEPAPRFTTRGPVYWNNTYTPTYGIETELDTDMMLQGSGCCAGIVEGIVKVITSPEDDMELNGHILVARHTDPGWIPLYPSVAGLLVERGSLLSHSAIVAREMGLPTVVGVKNLMATLNTGMRVRINGEAGTVEILT